MIDVHAWQLLITSILTVGVVVGGIAYVLSRVRRVNEAELKGLVETRGNVIDDLNEKLDDLSDRVEALEAEMTAVYKIKATEIANLVLEGLNGKG